MAIYRITKQERCKILNIREDVHDRAQLLIAEALNEQPPRALFWYDACKLVDPTTNFGRYHYLIDCGHGDAGDLHTMSFSKNVARMLETELGIVPQFVDKMHHRPEDEQALIIQGGTGQ